LADWALVKSERFRLRAPDDRLTNEFGAGFAASGVGGLTAGFLQSLSDSLISFISLFSTVPSEA